MTKTLREKYVANEILRIGDIVEDAQTGESLKIIDRCSNYITVISEHTSSVSKKWLNDVKLEPEIEAPAVTEVKEQDFVLTETGQVKLFGYETVGFDASLSEFIIEQFSEFDDMYAKHQIIKLLDSAIVETNYDRKYELLEKVSTFYTSHNIAEPIIVEGMKNELERRRIVEILATVAGSPVDKSVYTTAKNAVAALREKYTKRSQWEVLWPFLKMTKSAGITGVMQNLPFNLDLKDEIDPKQAAIHEDLIEILEDNFEELVQDLDEEDLLETFIDEDCTEELLSEEQLDEVLSVDARARMGRKMKAHENNLQVRRARALTRGATTDVLTARARRLAEVMLKRRMFRKPAADMSRQEKERFEKGAVRRRALVAKLAQRLIGKVRAMQTARQHAHSAAKPANPGTPAHHNNITQTGAA